MTTNPRKSKTSVPNTEVLTVRLPKRLANVIKVDAGVQGRAVADHHRMMLEFGATLSALAHVRDRETQRRIKSKGNDPGEYEAALRDRVAAMFLTMYGRQIPKDTFDLIAEVHGD